MEVVIILITVVLLALLAEVTYLVVKLPRQNISKKQGRQIFVDTSVLIDGRIIAVAQSGFIGDTLVIPRSVIGELQFLADNSDHDKRARARYGLDVVKDLQAMPEVTVELLQDGSKAEEGVDERLLTLAKQYGGAICTIDYNLNKVAQVEHITVLNVNELAQSLRMAYLPGEKILLELVQKGQDSHQAVGYLPDGTMVVVEHAVKNIGQQVEIEFIRSLQTAAGKMMFAKRVETAQVAAQPGKQTVVAKAAKPAGRRPQAPKHDKNAKHDKPDKADKVTAPATAPEKKPQPTRRQSATRQARQQSATSSSSAVKSEQPRPARSQGQRRGGKRPPSSADREAALIELLNKQSS